MLSVMTKSLSAFPATISPAEVVRSHFEAEQRAHPLCGGRLKENTTRIRNMRQYL